MAQSQAWQNQRQNALRKVPRVIRSALSFASYTRRQSDGQQLSLSDDQGPSAESSQESFEDSVDSDNGGRASHPLPAVRRRARRHSSPCSVSPRSRIESLEDSDSSRGETRRRRAQSRDRGRSRDGRISRSDSSSLRSDDDESGGRADRRRGAKGGGGNMRQGGERDHSRGRHCRRKKWRDTVRSTSGQHQQSNTTSDSGSESGSEDGYRERRVSKRDSQNLNLTEVPKKRGEDHNNASGRTTLQRARRAGKLDDGDAQSGTTSGRNSETRGSESEGSTRGTVNTTRRRRRAEQDDSGSEGSEWSSNKLTWDAANDTSRSGLSEQRDLSVLASNGCVEAVARETVPRSSGTDTDEGDESEALKQAPDSEVHSKTSPDHMGKDPKNSKTWESEQEQQASSGAQDVVSASTKAASRTENVGKPIRGARWGEAIGVRSRVFDTSTIPTRRIDLKKFVTCPLRSGPGTVLRCFIERDRSGIHKFSNMFSMYADLEDGSGRMLLAARKVTPRITCRERMEER